MNEIPEDFKDFIVPDGQGLPCFQCGQRAFLHRGLCRFCSPNEHQELFENIRNAPPIESFMNEIPNYIAEIESEFSRIRGRWSPLSPMDWQLADSWEQKGIPLHVVLNAMSEVFRKFEGSKKGGKINSISYFTQEVEKQFGSWKETQVGKSDESEEIEDCSDDYGFEVEPLSESARQVVLESLRYYKSDGRDQFIETIKPNYTPEDWQWMMENLEELK